MLAQSQTLAAFCLLALLAAPVHADYRTGEAAYQAQNYADAYLQLLPAAQAGDARAQFLIGQLSDNGLGPVALDPREAVRWYAMAAAKNHADAQLAMARAYATGRGVQQDREEALKWLMRAADNNSAQAILGLARLYDEGRGVEKDEGRATELIKRAAMLGSADGEYLLGERLAEGVGVTQDRKSAWTWFRRAAAQGHPAALYRLGRIGLNAGASLDDMIASYAWLTLAEQRGTGDVKQEAARDRAELARNLIPADIAAAMSRVKAWKPVERPASIAGGGTDAK